MRRTNRVFIFVISVLFGVTTLFLQAIQTERFGTFLSERISKAVNEEYGANISFEKIEFGFFPISTELINVEFDYQDYYVSAGKLGLEFGVRDLFSNKFSIGALVLKDSLVYLPEVKKKKTNEEEKKEDEPLDLSKAFSIYQNKIRKKIPFNLRGLGLENTVLNIGDHRIEAISANVSLFPNIFTLELSIGFDKSLVKEYLPKNSKFIGVNGVSGEFQVTKNYIRLKEARVLAENSYMQLSGKIFYDKNFQGVSIDSFLDLNKFKNLIPEDSINERIIPTGALRISGNIEGEFSKPQFNGDVIGTEIRSEVYNLKKIETNLSYKEGILTLNKARGQIGNGELELTEKVDVFDEKVADFLYPNFFLDVKNIYTNDILFFLPKLDVAKGYLTGPLRLGIKKSELRIKTFEGFSIKNFKLINKNNSEVIIGNPEYFLATGSNIVATYEGDVIFDTGVGYKNSLLGIRGKLGDGKVDVEVLPSNADLGEFGPIAGVSIYGMGGISGTVKGTYDDPVFSFFLSPENAEILGFKLGSTKAEITYNLKPNILKLNSLNGEYKGMEYAGIATFKFDDKNPMDMRFSINKGSWKAAKESLKPVVGELIPYLEPTQFNFSTSLRATGGFDTSKMTIYGKLGVSNFLWYAEDLETLSSDFSLKDSKLKFNNITAQKVSGNIFGKADFNLANGDYSYEGRVSNLRAKDIFYYRFINLGLDGDVFADFSGSGSKNDFNSRTHVRLINSVVSNTKLKDSVLTIYNNKKDVYYTASAIGGELKLQGYLNLDEKIKKLSTFDLNLKTKDIKSFAGVVSKHNITKRNLKGEVTGDMKGSFSLFNLKESNVDLTISDYQFSFPGIEIPKNQKPLVFKLKDGEFLNWDQEIKGTGFRFNTRAVGKLGEKFEIINNFNVSSSIIELVSDVLKKGTGSLSGTHKVVGNIKNIDQYMYLIGEDISFKANNLPGLFSQVNLRILFEKNVILIKKVTGKYGSGNLNGNGKITLQFPFPVVDLNLNVEKTKVSLLKKSSVVVSGDMSLKGSKLPYKVGGNLAIIKGEIIDNMNDLASSAVESDSYQRFIPVGYIEGNVSFLNMDLNVTAFDPILIKNGMIDIGLGGNLKVFGSVLTPKLSGDLAINNPENKFTFKGHEFLLSEGEITFLDGVRKEAPELRFNGVSRINDYDVFISVAGPADKMNVEMSSNPPLTEGDILSLITLGVTSDVSRNLEDRQRQSVTTLSIGTLLIDQLRINQSLNDSLGLRVSIQPEFIEDENNLLEGRVEDSTGGSRFRSSTVLKVQKRINKKTNLSLSSTVGGSVDQNQEMNLNYRINKSWSLEGVYEVRSNDELEQELPDSAGVDVKFQWSF